MVGHITIARRRYHCPGCHSGVIPLDVWGGVNARSITAGARRLLTLAGTSWSFDRAAKNLAEFSHITVSDDTIERVCQEEGERAQQWIKTSADPVQQITQAGGQIEFSTDGTSVNTTGGWREMRLSTIARREPTAPCAAEDWDDRVLNEPTARVSICAIADADHVGASWTQMSKRMNLSSEPVVHVLADGAKWIWDQAGKRLPTHNGKWCVDIYHVSQHLYQCGKELLGEGGAAGAWAEDNRRILLKQNGPGLIERLEQTLKAAKTKRETDALNKLLTYLRPNRDRMWYADRLKEGGTIGSGLIEGGCKNTIGARLKLNSARWRVRRAERIGMLRCLEAGDLWSKFWKKVA